MVKLLRWLLLNLDQPCPKDLRYEHTARVDAMGNVIIQTYLRDLEPFSEVEIYILEKKNG